MQFKTLAFAAVNILAVVALDLRQEPKPRTFTGTKVFHTIISQSPFLVERTTTFTWTQGTSISATATPTSN
ncbi:hypothetical protein NLJ89_g5268 [Agrocybe chaxingu]|uniref:Uncharacterized protein n=1 Tax=Agrocybe chaxingu TaxID=84603 RepID=A0A9W8MVS3_9AGAR|nr:hypothetical protein NLJ89_g5268 [Agrocybe chaxingu]